MSEAKKTGKTAKTKPNSATPKPARPADNNSFAVIETGGKQYQVAVGDSIKIEKMKDEKLKEGSKITFDKILLVDNGADSTDIGNPYIDGAKVSGTLIEISRNSKVTVVKYKAKSRYFKKQGHRQPYFKVKIDKIG